jgi:hypothetical protein
MSKWKIFAHSIGQDIFLVTRNCMVDVLSSSELFGAGMGVLNCFFTYASVAEISASRRRAREFGKSSGIIGETFLVMFVSPLKNKFVSSPNNSPPPPLIKFRHDAPRG